MLDKQISITGIGILMLLLAACSPRTLSTSEPVEEYPAESQALATDAHAGGQTAELANPASVNCQENSGELEIRESADGGQYGVCIFPDGSECEEWAFMRGECTPGGSHLTPSLELLPGYINQDYGFSFNLPEGWVIEPHDDMNYVRFLWENTAGKYALYIGYIHKNEEMRPFRTGMPSGDFVDGDSFYLIGKEYFKKLLVSEGKTKVVTYGGHLEAGDLILVVYLDPVGTEGMDYADLHISPQTIAEADQVIESFALLNNE